MMQKLMQIYRYKIALYFGHIKESEIPEIAYILKNMAFICGDIYEKNTW